MGRLRKSELSRGSASTRKVSRNQAELRVLEREIRLEVSRKRKELGALAFDRWAARRITSLMSTVLVLAHLRHPTSGRR